MHSPMFTLEVFPPKRNAPVGTIYDTLDGLEGLNPDFISVTYGHGDPFRPHRHRAHRQHDQQGIRHPRSRPPDRALLRQGQDR